MAMEITDETAFINLQSQLDEIDTLLDAGPKEGEAPEAFLKRLSTLAASIQPAVMQITPEDVDEEYFDEEDE